MEAPEHLLRQMRLSDVKFRRVCKQIILLDNRVTACKVRYRRAARHSPAVKSSLRLQLITLENVRQIFWKYMDGVADCLDEMQDRLMRDHGIDWDDVCDILWCGL